MSGHYQRYAKNNRWSTVRDTYNKKIGNMPSQKMFSRESGNGSTKKVLGLILKKHFLRDYKNQID